MSEAEIRQLYLDKIIVRDPSLEVADCCSG
jgi:hypothetical protein